MHNPQNRPQVRSGLAVVPAPHGLIVEGSTRRHLLTGRAATEVLPRLLPLLDGTRDLAAVQAASDLSERQLRQVLALLAARDLLAPQNLTTPAHSAAERYFARLQPSAEPTARSAAGELKQHHITLVARGLLAERIRESLLACGIGAVSVIDPDAARQTPETGRTPTIIVVQDGPGGGNALEDAVALGARTGPRPEVLRFSVVAGTVEVGPRFTGDSHTACLGCFRRGHAEAFPAEAFPQHEPQPLPEHSVAESELAAGLVSAAVLDALLGAAAEGTGARALWRTDTTAASTERFTVAPEACCDRCTPRSSEADLYEWFVQLPSPGRKPMQADAAQQPPAIAENAMDYATSPRRPLAPPEPVSGHAPHRAEALASLLLSRTAGFRPAEGGTGPQTRWAPTGGDLGSVELFLLTDGTWPELPGTVFRYDAHAHALVAARSDSVPMSSLLETTGMATAGISFAVVFVAATWRLASKYGDFSLRLAHLDAGCAVTQFGLLCRDLGLRATTVVPAAGAFAEHLELTPANELATALVAVHEGGPGHAGRA